MLTRLSTVCGLILVFILCIVGIAILPTTPGHNTLFIIGGGLFALGCIFLGYIIKVIQESEF